MLSSRFLITERHVDVDGAEVARSALSRLIIFWVVVFVFFFTYFLAWFDENDWEVGEITYPMEIRTGLIRFKEIGDEDLESVLLKGILERNSNFQVGFYV